jgi:hypothetical protein
MSSSAIETRLQELENRVNNLFEDLLLSYSLLETHAWLLPYYLLSTSKDEIFGIFQVIIEAEQGLIERCLKQERRNKMISFLEHWIIKLWPKIQEYNLEEDATSALNDVFGEELTQQFMKNLIN